MKLLGLFVNTTVSAPSFLCFGVGSQAAMGLRPPPRGVMALLFVGAGAMGTVFLVHRGQTNERLAMRQAVYDDIDRLARLEKAQPKGKA